MKRSSKILLYILFAIPALIFFIYARFPSEMIKSAISDRVALINPDAELKIDKISLTIPPGLKFKPLSVNYTEQSIFRMDDLKITPSFFSLFGQSQRYAYKGNIGNGILKGRAEAAIEKNREKTKVTMTLTRVPLSYIDLLNQWKNYKPDGELDANINYDSLKGGGTADINMTVSPARITFDPPLMGVEALDFAALKAKVIVTQRMLQIRNCDAVGDQLEGKITGSIVFRDPFEDSRLTLSITVKPQPAFIEDHKNDMIGGMLASGNAQKRGVVFRITGSIENPRYVIR